MNLYIVLSLFIVGAVFGSFAGASVWRLRARQLVYDKKHGDDYDKKELAKLNKIASVKLSKDRSRCLSCGHELKLIDLIPIYSWLSLGGKCRYCKTKIGSFEFIIETSLAIMFALSYVFWPYQLVTSIDILRFVIWLAILVLLAIMFAYDAKWFLLPDILMNTLIIIGLFWSFYEFTSSGYDINVLWSILGSVLILSGLYLLIYLVSRGKWIGFGDVKLGLGLALILADWKLAFMTLFAANLIGTIIVLPGLLSGKLGRMQHIPFGPLFIAGFVIVFLFGYNILGVLPFAI